MTKLAILTSHERQRFDSPPTFNADERAIYFALTNPLLKIIDNLRTTTNKVGFMLQLGYFKSQGKFYTADQFRPQDIDYIVKLLGLNADELELDTYRNKIPQDHRKKILTLLDWQPLASSSQIHLTEHILRHAKNQLSPKQIFLFAIDYCWQQKIEVPSYNQLALLISDAYNQHESDLVRKLDKLLTKNKKAMLIALVHTSNNERKIAMQRPPITLLRQLNQSVRPSDIQENLNVFEIIKDYFHQCRNIIEALSLSDQATEYFAAWVQKAETFQLSSFANDNKLSLYLLAYIKHHYYFRQDTLVDIFLKSVQATIHAANKQLLEKEKNVRLDRNKAIKKLSHANKDSRLLIEAITEIIKSPTLSESNKLTNIESLIDQYGLKYNAQNQQEIIALEVTLDDMSDNQHLFEAFESLSVKLQRRVSNIIKLLDFNATTSEQSIIEAIDYFKSVDGNVNIDAPLNFLSEQEKEAIINANKLRTSLYKILLFIHMTDAIKAGKLNLKHSYRYKAIQEYLIDKTIWEKNKTNLLKDAGLINYVDFHTVINSLKNKLNDKYDQVNNRFMTGENPYLNIETNKIKVSTPKIENNDMEYISSLLTPMGYVPILQVLSDVNKITPFVECFKHFSIKHKKMKPVAQTIYAGIIGKGCNIGIDRIANISVGITEDILKNTVNWCFSLKNIQSANNKVIATTSKLALANSFKRHKNGLHTGSDGRKVNVAVDSLHANYSFKYFGKGKGVSMYTFLDERQLLFHAIVISASDREAAYVIDGLLQNDVLKSDIHSTDTHGFTETIFAAMYFLGTAFAPRIKKVGGQKLYSFKSPATYAAQGYKILPSRTINQKLIETHWDDILRFMVTIKLKHTSASQLFKRLSSYANDHPLYQALKEFGRILKSQFILTYFDELELRQRIEKQLNKVELSNKFSKAVFFANNQEFKQGTKEEQEIATACMVLIQNIIVLWNYLHLSQLLANNSDIEQRQRMIESILHGSMITWQHINLHGEYDFTKHAANDSPFDMAKIIGLQIG